MLLLEYYQYIQLHDVLNVLLVKCITITIFAGVDMFMFKSCTIFTSLANPTVVLVTLLNRKQVCRKVIYYWIQMAMTSIADLL